MNEILSVILQIILILAILGMVFILFYLGLKSPRQNKMNNIDLKGTDKHGKFIGKT